MDLPTSYGSRLFSPFDWRWYAVDWVPIVDVYLWAILVGGLLAGSVLARWRPGAGDSPRIAAVALVLMSAHYGLRGWSHHQAIAAAPHAFGATLPRGCDDAASPDGMLDRWPRPARSPGPPASDPCLVEIAAIPTFLSPFDWRLIADLSTVYETRRVDVRDGASAAAETDGAPIERYTNHWTPAVVLAAHTRVGRVFLDFSRFPAAHSSVDDAGVATVQWTDVRFTEAPPRVDVAGEARTSFFMATVRIGPDGHILEQRLGQ
jgi:hypothetical protein